MRKKMIMTFGKIILTAVVFCFIFSCKPRLTSDVYLDPNMDLHAIRTVAVMPFENLTREQMAADRVRDVVINMLLSTGEIYVVPPGEVMRGILFAGIPRPSDPSKDEAIKLAGFIKVDGIITGVVREYGEVRSGNTASNLVSISLQMIEGQSGKVVWTATSTKGGVTLEDRLFGGGGRPMNDVTEEAVNEIIDKYFR
jgi:TolB-like protein